MNKLLINAGKLARGAPFLLQVAWRAAYGREFAFGFNVSDRCPIGCDCYWRAQARVKEMADDEAVDFFHQMRRRGLVHVTLVGGEPYVRPDLLAKLTPIMPANWLVTSGTTPLRRFPNTTHFISVDGKDAETHDAVRHSEGLFNRIIKNLDRARRLGNFPAFIHCVLNSMNHIQIGPVLDFWRKNGLADGVIFSTSTPIKGAIRDKHLRLNRDQRVWIVEELLRQKVEFGRFLKMSPSMIQSLHPTVTAKLTPKRCGTARLVASFDASGSRMRQCILSDQADCSQCGCVITTIVDTLVQPIPDLFTFGVLVDTMTI